MKKNINNIVSLNTVSEFVIMSILKSFCHIKSPLFDLAFLLIILQIFYTIFKINIYFLYGVDMIMSLFTNNSFVLLNLQYLYIESESFL